MKLNMLTLSSGTHIGQNLPQSNLLLIRKCPKFKEMLIWDNDTNAIDFRWSDVQGEDEEDIAKPNFIDELQMEANEIIKRTWGFLN